MEKISSILPATARVTTVDMRNSGASRPGMPSWGREVGVTAAAKNQMALAEQQSSLTTAGRANGSLQELQQARSKLDPKADIVKKMADSFFISRQGPTTEVQVFHDTDADMVIEPKKVLLAKPEDFERVDTTAQANSQEGAGEENTLATGQYIDVRA